MTVAVCSSSPDVSLFHFRHIRITIITMNDINLKDLRNIDDAIPIRSYRLENDGYDTPSEIENENEPNNRMSHEGVVDLKVQIAELQTDLQCERNRSNRLTDISALLLEENNELKAENKEVVSRLVLVSCVDDCNEMSCVM